MRKLLIVYNTCGISGRVNTGYYLMAMKSILDQEFDDFELAMSSCMNGERDIQFLKSAFGDEVFFNEIHERVPVSVTFNDTVDKCIDRFGRFEGYMFVDSGINFTSDKQAVSKMYDLFKSGEFGMVAGRTDDDMGFNDWYGTSMRGDELFEKEHLHVDLGRAVNLHVQIFSEKLRNHYGRVLPDIFAGQCMESVFTFMCAALRTDWIVHKDVVLEHKTGMDGPSSGFLPHVWQAQGKKRWDHLFCKDESILSIIDRGVEYGMGYEEIQKIRIHDSSKFDKDGWSPDNKLADYIRDNLFLKEHEFNYGDLQCVPT